MKNLKRFLFGAISTLLFVAGFARAADHFDPMSCNVSKSQAAISSAPDCASPCDVHDRDS